MKILVIGKPTYNVILPVEAYMAEGSKTKINEKLESGGGASFYTAYLLAKWGADVAYTGVVGSDAYGAQIKTELEAAGVDARFIETNYENPTSFNYLIVNRANGSSTQIIKDDSKLNLTKYKYDFIPDIIIMDGTDLNGGLAALNNFPKAKSIVFANRVSEDIYTLAKKATYVIANVDYAKALTKLELEVNKPKALVSFMQKIKDLNKAEYVVMMREYGVLYSSERQVKMLPAISIEKKLDDTNSGNIFFGTFCHAIVNNFSIDNAVKLANIAGGLGLTKLGTINAIPDLAEVFKIAGINPTQAERVAPTEPVISAPVETISDETAEPKMAVSVQSESLATSTPEAPVPVNTPEVVTEVQINNE